MGAAVRFSVRFLLAVSIPWPAFGEAPNFGRYDGFCTIPPAEARLLEDVADRQLDQHSMLTAALIVAGHDQTDQDRFGAQLANSVARCSRTLHESSTRHDQLRAIFAHLRSDFLYGEYQPDLYDLGTTMSDGDFNCLTATLLFQSLCAAFSIEIEAVWEPSHVQCWSPEANAAGFLIETTAALGGNAVRRLSRGELAERRLSSCELLAKVFYNRGVRALKTEQFTAALASNWVSCLLDPHDAPAQANLRACFYNWALSATQQNDYSLAEQLLEAGLALDPSYAPFSRNRAALLGQ